MGESSNTAQASGSSSSALPSHASPTILSTLHQLLLSSSQIPTPLNHPYAPATNYGSWKGKSRENTLAVGPDEQRQLLEQLRGGIEAAKTVLGRAVKEEGRSKLARAMKDVATHQSALLPFMPSDTASGSRPPSFRTPPKPMDLLVAISQRLGIETYLEESQFGLLKTTLAIAGKRFVLDVELEADSTALGDETDTPAPTPHPNVAAEVDEARGKVRLAKLVVNHVTADGGTANGPSVGNAIRQGLEAYLTSWNDSVVRDGQEEAVEAVIQRLWEDMSDLAALDGMKEEGGKDWFAELEGKAAVIAGLATSEQLIADKPSVLPRFKLLEGSTGLFRIRPSGQDENVTNPFTSADSRCDWILEYTPDAMPGMVVRRNWLSAGLTAESGVNSGTGVHVEQILCTVPESSNGFPYTAESAHRPVKEDAGLEQRWSVVQPGPNGYLVGRIGWSDDQEQTKQLLQAVRRQATLNSMITSILDSGKVKLDLATGGAELEDDGDEMDFDIISKAPIALPITLTITTDELRAVMPLPHATAGLSTLAVTFTPGGDATTGTRVDWEVRPEPDSQVRERIESALDAAKGYSSDPVETIRRIERALV